ncbi:MAG: pilus assembly protein [Sphingomonas paucimobilis]
MMRYRNWLRALRRDRRGVALMEFALSLPVVLPIGLYAVELSNFGVQQLRLSQATLTLSDNISRVGVDTNMATQQLREVDVNEVIDGLRRQTTNLALTTNGRVTISSLEKKNGAQWIHWQRCVGLKRGAGYDSSFGRTDDGGAAGSSFRGMGNPAEPVTAPDGAAVIFVEINYDYQPLISPYFLGTRKLQQTASYIVRDNRELASGVTDPEPKAEERMTCDRYTT